MTVLLMLKLLVLCPQAPAIDCIGFRRPPSSSLRRYKAPFSR
jgi:hypothetical protein